MIMQRLEAAVTLAVLTVTGAVTIIVAVRKGAWWLRARRERATLRRRFEQAIAKGGPPVLLPEAEHQPVTLLVQPCGCVNYFTRIRVQRCPADQQRHEQREIAAMERQMENPR